jgi:ABC-type anion transport system duplicated permease subunit
MSRLPTRNPQPRRRRLPAIGLVVLAAAALLALWFSHDTERVLRWIREHGLNAVAVTALGTILLVAATLGGPCITRRLARIDSRAADKAAGNRKTMIHRVRHQWIDQVLRTALVKPAMNSAANTHASTRKTQLTAVSQTAVMLAEFWVRSQSARPRWYPPAG